MADIWLSIVITSAICGVIAYQYARNTGRNPYLWTALGAVFNLLGMALICRPRSRS